MKNLKLIQFVVLMLISNWAFTQDLIVLRDGKEIKTKVIEIYQLEIKYKKFINLEGPTYTVMKSDVLMIKYENGEKDIFKLQQNYVVPNQVSKDKILIANNMSTSRLRTILRKYPLAYNKYDEGKNLYSAGIVIAILSDIYIVYDLYNIIVDIDNDVKLRSNYFSTEIVLSLTGVVVSSALMLIGNSKVKEAIEIYNVNSTSLRFAPVINNNGIGLAFKINF